MIFTSATIAFNPYVRVETIVIRGTASLAFIMLNVILAIGPLARLNEGFIPLLYNRRHLGVTMCLFALVHALFSIIQFHSLGDTDPIASIFSSNIHYDIPSLYPFQPMGFFALIIIVLMGVTSHDFWLHNLGPRVWKSLHMMVYVAYTLIIGHVAFGILQYETFLPRYFLVGTGLFTILSLHIAAARKEKKGRKSITGDEDMVRVCFAGDIPSDRAIKVVVNGCEIAIFRYDGKISAVNNLCKHQNGPLAEGKVVDGCITCP
jgi:DMSO/TMAO reductase YedYZ heme-binding membrane subunit